MQVNIRNYPLALLKDLELLLKDLRILSRQNSDVIQIMPEQDDLFRAKELLMNSPFTFRVFKPQLISKKFAYDFNKMPHNDNSVENFSSTGEKQGILTSYQSWINLVREYSCVSLSEEDLFERESQKEFIQFFNIVDEDSESMPFSIERLIFLNNILETTVSFLKLRNDVDLKDIIEDAVQLQNSIHVETKKVVINKLSKIFAKIKKKGVPFLGEFFTALKKEAFKTAIDWGFDGLIRLIHHVS